MRFSTLVRCLVQLAFLCSFQSLAHGLALGARINHDLGLVEDDRDRPSNSSLGLFGRQESRPEWLRILPLGASIVRGFGEGGKQTDGFRKPLRDHLREDGYQVNMVGSQSVSLDIKGLIVLVF